MNKLIYWIRLIILLYSINLIYILIMELYSLYKLIDYKFLKIFDKNFILFKNCN